MDLQTLTVRHIMTTEVETLRARQSMAVAGALMEGGGYHHLPVVDSRHAVVGLVTQRDLVASRLAEGSGLTTEERSDIEMRVAVGRMMAKKIVTTTPDLLAIEAAQILVQRRIGCLPVVDEHQRILGIVTAADYIELAGRLLRDHPTAVSEVMTSAPFTVAASTPLAAVAAKMSERRSRHLPVVDAGGALIGLITHRDLMSKRRSTLSKVRAFDDSLTAGDVMKPDLITAQRNDSLASTLEQMSSTRVGCVPVVDGDRLVGIITETDALAALIDVSTQPAHLSWRDLPVSYYTHPGCAAMSPDDTLELAAERFAAGVKLIAVWADRLLGVVSPPALLEHSATTPLREAMTRAAISVDVGSSVVDAARILLERDVHQCFVRRGDRFIGIFSRWSCLSILRDLRLQDKIIDSATSTLFTVGANEPVEAARKFLQQVETRAVLVQDDELIVGILGAQEVALAQAADGPRRAGQVASRAFFTVPESTPVWLVAAQAEALGASAVLVQANGDSHAIFTATDAARRVATLV